MNGCDSMSNTAARCNGHDLGLGISFAVGSNSGCGAQQMHQAALQDPYFIQISGNISHFPTPLSQCPGGYPQETHQGNHYSVAASNQLAGGTLNLSPGNNFKCGDQMLTGNVNVTVNGGNGGSAVLIVENGQLDLNGFTFQMADNKSALTIVFTGDNTGGYTHAPTDNTNGSGGVLNITAPAAGSGSPWQGMAIVQDPSLTNGVSVSAAGNSPTWDITGLIYMPHASITLKGAIDKSNFGNQCVVMVADNFQISGTGGVMKTDIGQCAAAGLNMPQATIPGSAQLVF